MSTQLKEKQQSKSKEQTPSRELQADFHFNQHIFRTVAYTAAGFGVGLLSSLLFKHKAGMTIFFAGAGAGYGSADFVNELNGFRSKRNPTQINKREGNASSQIKDQLQRTGDNLKGDLQQAKNKVERGVEDVSGKVAGQINQTARGAEEWARNASEKASQHFQQKNHSRGGDDDKDDSKSGKKDQQQTQKKDQKQQDTQKKDQPKKEDQNRQQDNQKKEKESGANATLKGGLSESAQREQGSKDHKLIGDNIRIDQYTNKIHDQNAFTGYNSPKQQWEGVKDKKEDKSVGGQGKSSADKNQTVNKGGQHFQDFHSNPNEAGKTTKVSDAKQDYQRNRNRAQEDNLDLQNRMRAQKHLQQDKHGESTHQGNNIRVDTESETKQGFQNYKTGVAPSLAKNQVNATLE